MNAGSISSFKCFLEIQHFVQRNSSAGLGTGTNSSIFFSLFLDYEFVNVLHTAPSINGLEVIEEERKEFNR